jgi:hypothetical protein
MPGRCARVEKSFKPCGTRLSSGLTPRVSVVLSHAFSGLAGLHIPMPIAPFVALFFDGLTAGFLL